MSHGTGCTKHGYTNNVYCPMCDKEAPSSNERANFERWLVDNHWTTTRNPYDRERYQTDSTQSAWQAWRARAALEPGGSLSERLRSKGYESNFKSLRESASLPAPSPITAIPDRVFDGYSVWTELQNDPKARKRTSHENVQDVLNAIIRFKRTAEPPSGIQPNTFAIVDYPEHSLHGQRVRVTEMYQERRWSIRAFESADGRSYTTCALAESELRPETKSGSFQSAVDEYREARAEYEQAKTSGTAPAQVSGTAEAGHPDETKGARAGHYYSPRPGTEVCFICGFHKREHAPEHFVCPRCNDSKVDPEPVMQDFGNGPEAQPQPCVACTAVSETGRT